MRLATLTLSLIFASAAALASDPPSIDQKGFDASNRAEFAGYQSYSQNNYSNGDNYRINGVKCPVPTLYFGGNSSYSDYRGHDPQQLGLALGIQIPLGTGRCEDAANAELRKMQWQLVDAEQLSLQRQEMHELEKAKMCSFMMSKGFEPPESYCQDVERAMTTDERTEALFVK